MRIQPEDNGSHYNGNYKPEYKARAEKLHTEIFKPIELRVV